MWRRTKESTPRGRRNIYHDVHLVYLLLKKKSKSTQRVNLDHENTIRVDNVKEFDEANELWRTSVA